MFIGNYYHTIEAKGRLAIPAKYRSQLEKGSVVTRGLDGCLFLFPKEHWERLIVKLRQSPLTQQDARDFVRLLVQLAAEVEFDSQGRTRIPKSLLEFAVINRNVVIAGAIDRIEIWDRENYHKYLDRIERQSEKIAERLKEFGI
jgi:MraZ protein